MRLTLAPSLLALAALVLLVLSASVPGQEVLSVDQFISESRGEVTASYDPRFPASPRESRQLYEERAESVTFASDEEVLADTVTKEAATPVLAETVLAEPLEEVRADLPAVSGNWSLQLHEVVERGAQLTLFQAGEVVYGQGIMTEGNNTQLMAAIGELGPDGLKLDLLAFGDLGLYRLDLVLEDGSMSGDYMAYGAGGVQTWSGTALGVFGST